MKDKLITYWEYCLNCVNMISDTKIKRAFFDQAFGALMFANCYLHAEDEKETNELWENEYRDKFNKAVYGV